jgi:hypothetical protein
VRHAMTHRRSGAATQHGIGAFFDAVPGLQRTTISAFTRVFDAL